MNKLTKKRTSVLVLIAFAVLALVVLLGCPGRRGGVAPFEGTVVRVGLVGEEMSGPWNKVIELMAAEGITVQLVSFGDYMMPNRALADGDIDLNSFQHTAFLNNEIANHGYQISAFGNTVVFFLGVYSHRIQSLDQLQNGDTIVIMNDPTNGGRALRVLEAAGVFGIDPAAGPLPVVADIAYNPRNITIVEVDAPFVYRMLDDPAVAAGVANSTFVVDAGSNPAEAAIFIKPINKDPLSPTSDVPFINLIVGRNIDRDNEVLGRVVAAFHSDAVRQVIEEQPPLAGIALPAW